MSENNHDEREIRITAGRERAISANLQGVTDTMADLREQYEIRLIALENEVASLRNIVQAQTQVIGDALQRIMGSGSTERDDG